MMVGLAFLLILDLTIDPVHRSSYLFLLAALSGYLALRFGIWLIKLAMGSPVPDSAVREAIKRCCNDDDEDWTLVRSRKSH
jgi:hypothetical protein